jgi:hypothetical protein
MFTKLTRTKNALFVPVPLAAFGVVIGAQLAAGCDKPTMTMPPGSAMKGSGKLPGRAAGATGAAQTGQTPATTTP